MLPAARSVTAAHDRTPDSLARWQAITLAHAPPAEEPFVADYLPYLVHLNGIVAASGTVLEGNLFYHHRATHFGDRPDPSRRHKRMMLAAYAIGADALVEVGFNAGHSALLALTANPSLTYLAIDIGRHAYTLPCFDYLHSIFGNRVQLRIGRSDEVLRGMVRDSDMRWRRVHVDGSHLISDAYSDLRLAAELTGVGGLILLDDVNATSVRAACNLLLLEGRLAVHPLLRDFVSDEQALLRVC
jgi:hypothetical protein